MERNRKKELEYLEHNYGKAGSQLLVVYGQRLIGKTTLLKTFVSDKPYIYYAARAATDEEQRRLLCEELGLLEQRETYFSYLDIFMAIENQSSRHKKVMIFDEFHMMIRQTTALIEDIAAYMQQRKNQRVLFLLCSSSVAFVENHLVSKIGRNALLIGGFYKVKEQGFREVAAHFPDYSFEDRLKVYSTLGGMPGLWQHFDRSLSWKENVCKYMLKEGAFLRQEGGRWVADQLREAAVYHTILLRLAQGHRKLNELHALTGFSRAKISVYLKNLMEYEIVEKVFSVDTDGRANTQKGIYQIKNHYLHFYFAFLWKNLSALEMLSAEDFYELYIEPELGAYTAQYYPELCREYVELLGEAGKLPFSFERSGKWVGKSGSIDFLAMDGNGNTLACFCHAFGGEMSLSDLEWDEFLLKQAKVKADTLYLFSLHGFSPKLKEEAANRKSLLLMDEKSLWENL
ncbi:MAG: ATP-binding protein [Lachnospiraceae bacterium]|nr:ATP-binding protein [Lachnospiraceae bacterium]